MHRISLWLGISDPSIYGLALNWAPVMQGCLDYVSERSGKCSSSKNNPVTSCFHDPKAAGARAGGNPALEE